MSINRIDIVGLGALGTMYADFFTRKLGAENVRILASTDRVEKYKKEKVFYNGNECRLNLKSVSEETTPSQLLIFCVKYGGLQQAMEDSAHLVDEQTTIISVLNGIRSEQDLTRRFGAENVLYCTVQKMDATKEANKVRCSNMGDMALGVQPGGPIEKLKRVTELFDKIQMPYHLPEDMTKALWSKLICNVGVNQTVTLFEGTYRCVHEPGEAREMMRGAMLECVAVGKAEGIDLSEAEVDYWMNIVDHLGADGEPSMRQDAKAGRKTEIALFAGTVCELGKKHGIQTPINDHFLSSIR